MPMTRVRRLSASLLASVAMLVLAAPVGAQDAPGPPGLKVVSRIAGPDGGWDYASFDPARRRIYVAHGDRVMAIDADTGAVTADFAQGAHLHAVVPVPGTNLLVTTNGGDASAKVLDATDGKLIASVPTAKDPDGATYDPSSGMVVVVNGDSGLVSLVDPNSAKVVGTITVGSGLEFPAADGRGKLYVNIEETGEIAVIDIDARKVLARYPMPGCKGPTGLALTADQRLISACANGVAKILDAATGRELASLVIGARPDAVLLDGGRGLAYIPSAMTGTLAVIALSGPAANTIIETAPTQRGARTGAVDLKNGKIYLPTADYAAPAAAGQRPSPKPGTFQVLVLDRG
jgi:DNA-binding beta-propeller fold protein YncE